MHVRSDRLDLPENAPITSAPAAACCVATLPTTTIGNGDGDAIPMSPTRPSLTTNALIKRIAFVIGAGNRGPRWRLARVLAEVHWPVSGSKAKCRGCILTTTISLCVTRAYHNQALLQADNTVSAETSPEPHMLPPL